MNEKIELSNKLGRAVVLGEGVTTYANALLHGHSSDLTYGDMQEFQDFTTSYFVHTAQGELVLLRKEDGVALRLTSEDPYTFEPDGTTVADYADIGAQ